MKCVNGIVRICRLPDRSMPSLAPQHTISFIKTLEVSKVFVQKIKDIFLWWKRRRKLVLTII